MTTSASASGLRLPRSSTRPAKLTTGLAGSVGAEAMDGASEGEVAADVDEVTASAATVIEV